jgi:DNA-binding CsgD family transcriptional regulator
MGFKKIFLLLFVFLSFHSNLNSESGIYGQFQLDTTVWKPVAYLSLIPSFNDMYSMSYSMIIDQATIDHTGSFSFSSRLLPEKDHLFRIHFSKKEDPAASLIIGGKDENHFFLIANQSARVLIRNDGDSVITREIIFEGYYPNIQLQQINQIAAYLDSASFETSPVISDLIRSGVFENLRAFADTCSNYMVCLFALYKSRFESNYQQNRQYYKDFLLKWENEDSIYLEEFRNKIPIQKSSWLSIRILLFGAVLFIAGFFSNRLIKKSWQQDHNRLKDLTVQERKVFSMIMDGKTNKEISELLMISLSTVKSHVNSIYSKLEINSRKDALNLFHQENPSI